ncbi:MAG: SusC/RagA family TonB-linked outer membrane protein [Bacteroidales bacterium]|nr:SusC/RagA family TonB-linked outer membrane protein [Bacteroidales bacterium]
MKQKVWMMLACLFLSAGLAMAQIKVTGTVTSAEDNEPIVGASVLVKGTTLGTITDMDGKFVINNVPESAHALQVSYIGMQTQSVNINKSGGALTILLKSDTKALEEVVVTAMGISREKKALGYALQEVKAGEITKGGQMNVVNSLSGKVSGVQITAQGGQIGASQNIVIRGNSSFGNNAPLIVVDGVPVQNDNGTGGSVNLGSGLNDINPEDIESVSVLKGGSAALYGMRAGNGVILITTKSGKKDKGVQVSYDGSFTVDKIYNLPGLQNKYGQGYNGTEYDYKEAQAAGFTGSYQDFALKYGYVYKDGAGSGVNDDADESWGPRLDIGLKLPQFNSPVVDGVRQATPWVSHPDNIKNFFVTGYSQNHMVSLTSATEKSSTRASLAFRDQKGTTPNTDQKRYSAALNTKMKVNKYIDFDLSANFIRTQSDNLPGTGYDGRNVLQSLLQWHGRQIDMEDLKANYDKKDEQGNYTHYNWQTAYATNPYWVLYHNLNKYTRDRFYGKTSVFVKPTEWLKFEGRLGFDHFDSNQFSNVEWSVDYPDGYFRDYDRRTTEINADFIAYFTKQFGDLNVNALAGANYRDYNYGIKIIGADELTVPGLYTVANAKGSAYNSQNHETRRSNSVYGNLSLGWKNQLYADISLRNDWDSTIKEDFFYPSFSGSWILTETFPTLTQGNYLNFLKLRGGWAKIGNATDPYLSNAYYSVMTAPFNGTTLYYNPTTYPATSLRPEMVKTWEVGLEAHLLNSRLRIDGAYYQRTTTDQIMEANVATSTGYNSMFINAGKISNKGIELQISADIFKNSNGFSWTSTLNWSKDKSRIDELYTDPNTGQSLNAYEIGSSWSVYNYAMPGKSWGTLVGTGYVYNEDGSILVEDGMPVYASGQVIGDVTPDWLAGWSNEFSYKNWSFGFLLDFRKGGDIFSISQAFGTYTGIYDYTAEGDLRENGVIVGKNFMTDKVFKTADGKVNDVAVNAEDFFGQFYSNRQMSVFDGSFLKLREIHLTYTFPKSLLQKTKCIKAANLSLIANNVALLWVHDSNLTHMDPESTTGSTNSGVGFESNSYPPTRSIGMKLGLTF